ncbi:hypothetical protein IKF92_02210 [Candidatus Saccharibacteria bacterium]|nr:hypothetical protein [Candidatus Saccharibacteria bacterium]
MDNGQSTIPTLKSAPATSGTTLPIDKEKDPNNHNLDLTNQNTFWGEETTKDEANTDDHEKDLLGRPNDLRGAKTLETSQTEDKVKEKFADVKSNFDQPMGQVVDMEMPPSAEETATRIADNSVNRSAFKTTESLNDEGIKETDVIIDKIKQARTGEELAASYDLAREAMEDNLNNSYHRKLAA